MTLDLSELDVLKTAKGLILAPNHPSMIDVVLIMAKLENCSCIAKNSLMSNPLLGMSARANQYIASKNINCMIHEAEERLSQGENILIFPESTRTDFSDNRAFGKVKGSAVLISKRAQAPLQLLYIHTNSRFLGKDWPLLKRPNFPIEYRVQVGVHIEPSPYLNELVNQTQAAYAHNLRTVS